LLFAFLPGGLSLQITGHARIEWAYEDEEKGGNSKAEEGGSGKAEEGGGGGVNSGGSAGSPAVEIDDGMERQVHKQLKPNAQIALHCMAALLFSSRLFSFDRRETQPSS
jgi:hypothetical protein